MSKKPSFESIAGGTLGQKSELIQRAKNASETSLEELVDAEYLVEPTSEEQEAIEKAVNFVNKKLKEYGLEKRVNSERIALLKPDSVSELTDGDLRNGVHNGFYQTIAVERQYSTAVLAHIAVHELFHAAGYRSAQIDSKGKDVPYRSGISMRQRDGDGKYFYIAEEAMAAGFSNNFYNDVIKTDESYSSEMERTEFIKNWLISHIEATVTDEKKIPLMDYMKSILVIPYSEPIENMLASSEEEGYKFGYIMGILQDEFKKGTLVSERNTEKDTFDTILEAVMDRDQSGYLTKDMLVTYFRKAHFTGNYIPLAKLIEKYAGKGEFRKIATELGINFS